MTLTKYHPSRDLSVAKVRNIFYPYIRLEKTRWACGKKSEGSTLSLHYVLLGKIAVWLGYIMNSFMLFRISRKRLKYPDVWK